MEITREHVIWAYRLFLEREADSESSIQLHQEMASSIRQLRNNFLNSDEYKLIASIFWDFVDGKHFAAQSRCIFLHIPKVAGAAFSLLLTQNYENFCLPSVLFTDYTEREYTCATVYEGHFKYSSFCSHGVKLLYLAAVREPTSRALSLHNYYKRYFPTFWNPSLRASIDADFTGQYIDNYQCRYISGQPSFDAVLEVWEKENFVVGCFDYLQEFVNTCADLLHWKNRELPRENVASDPNYKQKYLEEPGLMELLRERNQEDQKLYEYVKSKQVVNTIKPDFDLRPLYPRDCAE